MGRALSLFIISCVVFASGCTVPPWAPDSTAKVGEGGFVVQLDRITAHGAPGVAVSDTKVEIQAVARPQLPDAFSYVPEGPAFDLSLEGGAQPRTPITVSVELNAEQSKGQIFFVTQDSATGQWQGLPVSRQGSKAQVEMSHLSTGFFGWIDGVGESFSKGLNDFLQLRFDPPACLDNRPEVDGRAFEVSADGNGVYACIDIKQGSPSVTVYSNSPFVWRITPVAGEARGLPAIAPLDSAQIITLAAFNLSVGYDYDRQTLLVPSGNAGVELLSDTTSTVIKADVDAALGLLAIIAAGVQMAFTVYGITFTPAQLAEAGDCFAEVVDIAIDPDPGRVLGTVLGCFGAVAGGAAGVVAGVLTSLSSLLVTQVVGIVGEVTQTNHIEIAVDSQSLRAGTTGFAGVWRGPIEQPGARDYSVVLQLEEGGDGRISGTVAYAELECSGYLDDPRIEGSILWITEHITKQGTCVPLVPLRLELEGDTLRYQTVDGYNATGILQRDNQG